MYLGVYIGLSIACCLFSTLRFFLINYAAMQSSKSLFQDLLSAVMAAPLRWLDTIPVGRILNRFTSDICQLDLNLGMHTADFAVLLLQTIGILVSGIFVSPVSIVLAFILLAVTAKLGMIYLNAAREIKRLQSVSNSPVFDHFTSSLIGLTTVRAFAKVDAYDNSMFTRINRLSQTTWYLWLFNSWTFFRVGMLGAVFSTLVSFLVVKLGISASLAGFAISFVLQYNSVVSFAVHSYGGLEMGMNSTERVVEYANIETESQGGIDPPAAWPTRGRVEVNDLVVGYAPELPPVLDGRTFTIENNQRVGVVGRTAAGKSSLTLALFRFLEPRQGQVFIDGLDIHKMKLSALREQLAIVPQHPVLFSGTIRSNLDPFNRYPDTEVYSALERVYLVSSDDEFLQNQFTLSTPVSEGGLNFSQGQRQLLCLARSVLQRPKIMLLDEATSAVDKETDDLIQQAIRDEFGRNSSSLLVIAHRLSTVADFDRILVMDQGKMVEFGTPRELLDIMDGVFRGLVNQSGEKAVLERIIYGKN